MNLVSGSIVFSGHSNTRANLLPGSGNNRLFFIGQSVEVGGATEADTLLTSVVYRGETATEVGSAFATGSAARGIQLFVFTESQVQTIEAGSGDVILSNTEGVLPAGAYESTFCFTLDDCVQAVPTATVVEGLNSGDGDVLPHSLTLSGVTTGQLCVFAAHLSQPDSNTWVGASEDYDGTASTFSTSIATQTATSDGDVTAGVSPDAGISYSTNIIGFAISAASASNQAPVADDDTFSVPENAQNGDVVGTYTATDSDGTITGYSITGTQLAIDNSGQITIADNTGFTAGQQIVETVTATDDDGATDPATITVNITAVALSFSVDNANPEAGETVTLTIANGTGPYTAEFDGSAIALATQNASGATIAWPNMQTHGSRYNQAADLVLTDTSNGQTHTVQITPAVLAADYFGVITALTGLYADYTDVVVGDESHIEIISGSVDALDVATGFVAASGAVTLRNSVYDISAGVWFAAVDHVIAAPNNPATGAPTISGSAQEGGTLTGDVSTIVDDEGIASINLQWQIDGVDVDGETALTYNIRQGDVGSRARLIATVIDNEGAETELPSVETAIITQLHDVVIDTITPARTTATVEFSYAGTALSGFEYNIGAGWVAVSASPLNITGLTEDADYTLQIRPVNSATGFVGAATSTTFRTNVAVDTTPNAISFAAQNDVARDVFITSAPVTIQGVDAGVDIPISIVDGEYSYSSDGGTTWSVFTSDAGNVRLNYQVIQRHRSALTYATQTTSTLNVGGVLASLVSTTLADEVAPVIQLIGGNQQIVEGTEWAEPGYSATDNADGVLPLSAFEITGDDFDWNAPGTYVITYRATDSAGNVAITTRTVVVTEAVPTDAVPPVISLVGGNVELVEGEAYVERGFTATDNVDGDITGAVNVSGVVGSAPGQYELSYTVADAAGNTTTVKRLVTVRAAVEYPTSFSAPDSRTITPMRQSRVELAEDVMIKDPVEQLDYDFDLSDWLAEESDSLSEDRYSVTVPDAVEVLNIGLVPSSQRVKVWLAKGVHKKSYSVELTIITDKFRTARFAFRLMVIDKE